MSKQAVLKKFDKVLDKYFRYLVHYQYDINNKGKDAKKRFKEQRDWLRVFAHKFLTDSIKSEMLEMVGEDEKEKTYNTSPTLGNAVKRFEDNQATKSKNKLKAEIRKKIEEWG